MKKYLLLWATILMVSIVCVGLVSCGDDDDDSSNVPDNLIGVWYGESKIERTGTIMSINVSLNKNGSGTFEYQSSVYYRFASFRYSFSKNTVSCKGVIANQDGDVNENWTQKFRYDGHTLTPIDNYSNFTLYRK